MTSRPLFMSVAESIEILPPMSQVGCASASSTVTSASSARVRPRNGPPDAVSTSLSTVPGRSPASSWCSAECSESTGRICAPVASASAMTSSPPTTSDSLLASARSIPSPSVATVGPRPAEPTSALRTRSAPDSSTSRTSPSAPIEHLAVGPRLGGARAGVGVGERDAVDAERARLLDQRVGRALGAQADELELGVARDDVERLGADRAGRAEDEEAAGHVRAAFSQAVSRGLRAWVSRRGGAGARPRGLRAAARRCGRSSLARASGRALRVVACGRSRRRTASLRV